MAKLELSMNAKEEDSPMQSTDIQTGKSEYPANDAMTREQHPITSGPLTTIGSFIYHNFEFIDNALLFADKNFEQTDLNSMLKHASNTSKTDIKVTQYEQIRHISVDALPCFLATYAGKRVLKLQVDSIQRFDEGVELKRDVFKKLLESNGLYEQPAKDQSGRDLTNTLPTLSVPSLIVGKTKRTKPVKQYHPESKYMHKKRMEEIEADKLNRQEQLELANRPHEENVNVMLRDQQRDRKQKTGKEDDQMVIECTSRIYHRDRDVYDEEKRRCLEFRYNNPIYKPAHNVFGIARGEKGQYIYGRIRLQKICTQRHISEWMKGFNDRIPLDLENAKAVLMKLINIETTLYKRKEDRQTALISLVLFTNRQKTKKEQSQEAKKRKQLILKLSEHPEEVKWIESIEQLDRRSVITGHVTMTKYKEEALLTFDLCLVFTPKSWVGKSILQMIKELVCCLIDLAHRVAMIKHKMKLLEPLPFLYRPIDRSLKVSVFKPLKALNKHAMSFILPYLVHGYIEQLQGNDSYTSVRKFVIKLAPHIFVFVKPDQFGEPDTQKTFKRAIRSWFVQYCELHTAVYSL